MTADPDALDMHAAAAEAGVHYDTFKKRWRAWSDPAHPDHCAFPAPFRYPQPGKRGGYAWRRSAVAEWKAHRERAFGAGRVQPVAPHVSIQRAAAAMTSQVLRQRAELARLMERA